MALKAKDFTASTYNSDKGIPLQKKAVEEERNCIICIGCELFDWWNGGCIKDDECKRL